MFEKKKHAREKELKRSAKAAIQEWKEDKSDLVPIQTSDEVKGHNLTHIPFNPWRPICLVAKGKGSPHAGHKQPDQMVQADWCYLKKSGQKAESMTKAWAATLTIVRVNKGCTAATSC